MLDRASLSAAHLLPASTFPDKLGFQPPPEDEGYLGRIRETGEQLARKLQAIVDIGRTDRGRADSLRREAELLAIDLDRYATELANTTTARQTPSSPRTRARTKHSRNLFIGVAAGAIVLALLLGFVLSWSVIGPIQRIDSRLAAIASGDFSGHVDVANRDELGALGAQRQPDERRAPAPLQGARDDEPAQVGVPGQHVRTSCARR